MSSDDSDLDHAADDIRWIGQRLKGLMAAADALKNLGSINNAINEKTAMHDQLIMEIGQARESIAALHEKIAALTAEHTIAQERLADTKAAHQKTLQLLQGALGLVG